MCDHLKNIQKVQMRTEDEQLLSCAVHTWKLKGHNLWPLVINMLVTCMILTPFISKPLTFSVFFLFSFHSWILCNWCFPVHRNGVTINSFVWWSLAVHNGVRCLAISKQCVWLVRKKFWMSQSPQKSTDFLLESLESGEKWLLETTFYKYLGAFTLIKEDW